MTIPYKYWASDFLVLCENDLNDTHHRAVILTSTRPSSVQPDTTFISRMFAPISGIPEDPVTGAAHCLLTPYWSRILGIQSGQILKARQVSPRGGSIDVVWKEDDGTVLLRGEACVVAEGEIFL
jgi:predicted PhzF superfamily epimerase YddE/YHI9